MTKYLLIAGHGRQRDGSFDPGATGFITKGEHKYMRDDLFPAMKKFLPKDVDVVFYDERKVSNYGNLIQLVRQYKADEVIEFHYDAFSSNASGGHVIIHTDYTPDAMDLRIRDVINEMVGLRFTHKGHKGISGRSNLYNVNLARKNGITYRLLELGFGTNKKDADIMVNRVEEYAKKLVEAILNKGVNGAPKKHNKPVESPKPATDKSLNFNQVVTKAMAGEYGNQPQREKNINEQTNFSYREIQEEINRRAGGGRTTSKPEPTISKTVSQMAHEIEKGIHGNGHENRRKSLGVSQATYNQVRAEVNKRAGVKVKPRKSVDQMAREIIAGKHGNGHSNRRMSLGISDAEYQKVRARVNQVSR